MLIEQESFLVGFLAGFIVAGYFGWLMGRIRADRSAAKRSGQVAAVTVKSEKSPSEIVREATAASMRTLFWTLLLILSAAVIGYWLWSLMA